MKRIFLDTNFIVDYFVRESYSSDAEKVLSLGKMRNYKFYISYLTIANFAYILRKMPKSSLVEMLTKICHLFEIVPNNKEQITNALLIDANDFEDVLQYQSAISAKCNCIITRNQKDFSFSKIPVLSASEFVSEYL
ncbi:MAG: PIN domain-containing protein [Muribaculum sp.]|nr:PIN domain-containing protein [Muribaculum sp.]